jgi:hypothetical protein
VLIAFLMLWWQMIGYVLTWVFMLGCTLSLIFSPTIGIFILWYLPEAIERIPVILLPVLSSFILLIWLGIRIGALRDSPVEIKGLTVIILIAAGIYLIGNASGHLTIEQIRAVNGGGHHYFLNVQSGFLGDSDTLQLYGCNQYAFNCREIYRSSGQSFYYRPQYDGEQPIVELRFEEAFVRLYVDNELWFEHNPGER